MTHELVIGEERFPCRDEMPAWSLMKLAKATQGNEQQALAGMYDLVMGLVLPDEHTRFDAYMSTHAVDFDTLNEAIGALMTGYTDRPTERPSPSPAGQMPTGRPSRVVSWSAGTVREVEKSTTDGAQAVS